MVYPSRCCLAVFVVTLHPRCHPRCHCAGGCSLFQSEINRIFNKNLPGASFVRAAPSLSLSLCHCRGMVVVVVIAVPAIVLMVNIGARHLVLHYAGRWCWPLA